MKNLHCSPVMRLMVLTIAGLFVMGESLFADDQKAWPQFLGPTRQGVSEETGLLRKWPADGPPVVWRAPFIGGGMSGLAIVGDMVYTLGQKQGQQFLIALNAKTGKGIWETPVSSAYKNSMGDGPRATPTVVGETVIALTGEGKLVALTRKTGKVIWARDVVKHNGSDEPAEYGMSCSPLVVDGVVIVVVGAKNATVAGYDVKSGERKWTAGDGQPAGYSSPVTMQVDGKTHVVLTYGTAAEAIDPSTGQSLWKYPFPTDYNCNTANPVVIDNHVFLSAGENHGCVLLSVKREGDRVNVAEVWTSLGPKSVMRSEWQTPLVKGRHLFGFDNVGGAGPVTHLTCIDAKTGNREWQQLRFGKGNAIAADGLLIISTIKGELVLVEQSAEKFSEVARAKILGMTRQAPCLVNGFVYLRDDREIVCVDLRKK